MKKISKIFIMFVLVNAIVVPSVSAQDKLIFSTFENSGLTLVEEPVLREVYKRLGFEIEIRQFPGDRALKTANEGKVDGELARLAVVQEKYKNLVMIPEPIHYLKGVVFTKEASFSVSGWESLKPYTAVTLRGYKYTEKMLREHGIQYHLVPRFDLVFKTLDAGRHDIALLTMLDGLKTLKELKLTEIRILESPLETFPIYHFVHKKHKHLAPQIGAALQDLKKTGFIEKIEREVIADLTGD